MNTTRGIVGALLTIVLAAGCAAEPTAPKSKALDTQLVTGPPSGGGAVGLQKKTPARDPNLACHTADSPGAEPYRAMLDDAIAKISAKLGRSLSIQPVVTVDTRENPKEVSWMYTWPCAGVAQSDKVPDGRVTGCTVHIRPRSTLARNVEAAQLPAHRSLVRLPSPSEPAAQRPHVRRHRLLRPSRGDRHRSVEGHRPDGTAAAFRGTPAGWHASGMSGTFESDWGSSFVQDRSLGPRGRRRDPGADATLDVAQSATYCTLGAPACKCPPDSERAGTKFTPLARGVQYLGVTGGLKGAKVTVTGQSLEDFCAVAKPARWRSASVRSRSSLDLEHDVWRWSPAITAIGSTGTIDVKSPPRCTSRLRLARAAAARSSGRTCRIPARGGVPRSR